jgi:hypothetical protein
MIDFGFFKPSSNLPLGSSDGTLQSEGISARCEFDFPLLSALLVAAILLVFRDDLHARMAAR